MRGSSAPVLWLVRRVTGIRLYHLFGLLAALTVALAGMALPFWWLGEQAQHAVGPVGVVLVAIVYMYAALLVLAFAAVVVGRVLIGRLRRLFA